MSNTIIWPRRNLIHDVRVAQIIRDLANNSRKLFSPPHTQIEVEVAEVATQGIEGIFLESESELQEHLSIYHPPEPSSPAPEDEARDRSTCYELSFFFLEPAYGWAALPITQDGMLRLLAALNVFPNIYRYLTAFGRKSFAEDEGFAGFDSVTTLDSVGGWASFESCYLLKYVARREAATAGKNPWSIRHALVYQKISHESKRASHILIRIPERVKQHLADCILPEGMGSVAFVEDWTSVHATCFSSIDDDLRQYINYLDEEVTKVFEDIILSGVNPAEFNEFDSAERFVKDFKTLQYLSEQARRLIHVIDLNMDTIKCFKRDMISLIALDAWASARPGSPEGLSALLDKIQQEHEFILKNASAVLERAKTTSEQLRDTASLRNTEIGKWNAEMANMYNVTLAQSRGKAQLSKALEILALVLVPASIVGMCDLPRETASWRRVTNVQQNLLQMGFVTIVQNHLAEWDGGVHMEIYAGLTILLVGVTTLIYEAADMLQRTR